MSECVTRAPKQSSLHQEKLLFAAFRQESVLQHLQWNRRILGEYKGIHPLVAQNGLICTVFLNDNSYCSWTRTQGNKNHWFDFREDLLCSCEIQIHPNSVLFPLPHTQFERLYRKDKHREDFLLKMQHSNAKQKRFTR